MKRLWETWMRGVSLWGMVFLAPIFFLIIMPMYLVGLFLVFIVIAVESIFDFFRRIFSK